jgi:hypothetical protein
MFFFMRSRRAKAAALAIDNIFQSANHARLTAGSDAMVGIFKQHPWLRNHESGNLHVFKLGDVLEGLAFMVLDQPAPDSTSPMMARGFDENYAGLIIETDYSPSNSYGPYRLKLVQPSRQGFGLLVRPVARALIRAGLAYDLAEVVERANAELRRI